jgi:hypothetical protein
MGMVARRWCGRHAFCGSKRPTTIARPSVEHCDMSVEIPTGFTRLQLRPNPCIDACGPLYGRRDGDRFVLGLLVERATATRPAAAMAAC